MQKEVNNWVDFRSLPFSIQAELAWKLAILLVVSVIGVTADIIADFFRDIYRWSEDTGNAIVKSSPLKKDQNGKE